MVGKKDEAAEARLVAQVRQARLEGKTNEQILDDLCISQTRLQRVVREYAIPVNTAPPNRALRASLRRL